MYYLYKKKWYSLILFSMTAEIKPHNKLGSTHISIIRTKGKDLWQRAGYGQDYLSLLSIIHVLVCYRFPTKHLDKIRVIRHLSIPPACFQLGNPKSILESSRQGRKILHPKTCPSRCWPKSLATKISNFSDLIDFTCKSFQQ